MSEEMPLDFLSFISYNQSIYEVEEYITELENAPLRND